MHVIGRRALDLAATFGAAAGRVKLHKLDLAEEIPVSWRVLPEGQALDILIHCAGTLIHSPFGKTRRADWEHTFAVNVFGVAELTQRLLPHLQAAERPHIVTIGSMGGYQGASKFPGLSAYSASKGALTTLSECLAVELAEQNIAVNCLCLGAVNTDMLRQAFPGYDAPVQPEEVARYIVNFALSAHEVMNGRVVPVACGDPG